ncbi:MAG TPA: LysR family transcriptional regulator [Polyangiaceae bacterium]|jgi:DNA-binding transcriptional LysR family regulator
MGSLGPSAEDMLVFAAVARAGGVRRGAQALGIPRSTASRHLASLERAVSARLVARSTRQFVLTDVGRTMLEQCVRLEDVMRSTEGVVARTATEPSGTLRVATSPVIAEDLLPKVLAEYLARYPNVRAQVDVAVDFVDLRRAGIDVAVRTGPIADASDLWATRLGNSPKGHYVSPAYAKKHGVPKTPDALAEHSCIVIGAHREALWTFRGSGRRLHQVVSGALQTDNYRLARAAAAAGIGVARLPHVFAEPLVASGELVPVLEKYSETMVLYAVHAAGSPAPPKIRAFIEMLRAAFARKLRG